MKKANAKEGYGLGTSDGYGIGVCAKEGIGYANEGCDLKGEQQEGWDWSVGSEGWDGLKMANV